MIYYSPSKNAFFDDALSGPRFIEQIDDEAYRLAKAAAIDADRQDFEAAVKDAGDATVAPEGYRRHELALILSPPTQFIPNAATQVPEDAIEVALDRHAELLEAQSRGLAISAGPDGQPTAVDQPPASVEEQLAAIRRRRDRALAATDWTQVTDALTTAKRKLWAEHRQALRDLPALVEKAIKAGKSVESVRFPPSPGQS